jgi:hypothetical protein
MNKPIAYLILFLMAAGNVFGGYIIWKSTGSMYLAIALGATVGWIYACVKAIGFILAVLFSG